MPNKRIYLFTKYSTELIMMFFFVILVIPGFRMHGDFVKQMFITTVFSFLIILFADRLRVKPVVFSHGLAVMTGYWGVVAIIKQVQYHIENGLHNFVYYNIFGYDKYATLFVIYVMVLLYYAGKLFMRHKNKTFVEYYREMNRFATISFIIFIALLWLVGFIFYRQEGMNTVTVVNLKPFTAFRSAFLIDNPTYSLYVFFGNIALFVPFGTYLTVALKGKAKLILPIVPVIVSCGIEALQYYFLSGEADIDDVILNVLGFYLGILIKFVTDKIIQKRSNGAIKSFFIF